MKIRQKFFKTNLTFFTVGLDIFYIIIFFVFYLIKLKLELTLSSVFIAIGREPILILLIIHPLLLWIVIKLNIKENQTYQQELESNLKKQNKKIEEVYKFVEILRNGGKFQFSQEFQRDKLVRSMLNLRDELEEARKEEEQRKKEEQHRHWTNEGLAKFGAILRENVDDLEKLASKVTSNLTRYLNSQQAGFFIIKEEDGEKYIQMLALFAFDRKKFPDKKFLWGEGLIGSCAIEQKTIFLKDTSDSFVDITSGLGNANPRSILIVPIKDNDDQIHGVLEIASFKIFEDYEVSFVEQVAESIGLTIASIKTNIRTQELLKESQKQAEMLAQQEAEMRQKIKNIEEQSLKTINTAKELELEIKALSKGLGMLKLEPNNEIIEANKVFSDFLKYPTTENFTNNLFENLIAAADRELFSTTWNKIFSEKTPQKISLKFISFDNKFVWLNCYFTPIINEDNNIEKIIVLTLEATEELNTLLEYQSTILTIDNLSIEIEIDPQSKITQVNEKFSELTNYQLDELIGKKFEIIFPQDKKDLANIILSNAKEKGKYKTITKIIAKNKQEIILEAICAKITDINDQIIKYKFLANDITEEANAIENYHKIKQELEKANTDLEKIDTTTNLKIKQAKQKLLEEFKQAEHQAFLLNNLLENLQKSIIIIEEDNIILFNKYAEQIFGYKKDIVIGKKIQYIFPTEENLLKDQNYIMNHIDKNFTQKEVFIIDKNQKRHYVIADFIEYSIDNKNYKALIIEEKNK
jgi:PAS domain S-box-containing protein